MKSSISLLLSVSLLSLVSILLLLFNSKPSSLPPTPLFQNSAFRSRARLKVHVADLPRSLNYGLLDQYWSLTGPDSRIGTDPDGDLRASLSSSPLQRIPPPYPENPLIKQYSAEYWLLRDLETPDGSRAESSAAERVYDWRDADVVFVPFFATLSAEMELGWGKKGSFLKKDGNADYLRQREVVDRISTSEAWKRSGGRDHVFVLTDPVAMWHVRAEISAAVLLLVDFGGWYKLDAKAAKDNSSTMIQHTQVSLLKDVIVPYTHLLPILHLSEDRPRHTLLYFKGAKHRHRGGLVREKLWDLLQNEPGVIMEEGFPNATGREQSISGMRGSDFCLHPAGDTPTSCRLFDAVSSLCVPVVVSDHVELPFEGTVDYTEFSVFVSVDDALRPGWLVRRLRAVSDRQKDGFRRKMAEVQALFDYEHGGSAVNHVWTKVEQKLPFVREAVARRRRKPDRVTTPQRCLCV